MTDYVGTRANTRHDSATRSCVVPVDGTTPPEFLPTAILADADGVITGWLEHDDQEDDPRDFPVVGGVLYPLRLALVDSVSGVTAITGLSGG
jgi:hypothetical protein